MAKVQIVMRGGVVGEDGTDWLAGESKDATAAFARDLVARDLADYASDTDAAAAHALTNGPGGVRVVHGDPTVVSGDPVTSPTGKKK